METDLYHVSKQRHYMLFKAVKFDGFSRIDGVAEPDFHHLANAVNDMPHIMVEDCLSYLDWCRRENRNGYMDVLHDITPCASFLTKNPFKL